MTSPVHRQDESPVPPEAGAEAPKESPHPDAVRRRAALGLVIIAILIVLAPVVDQLWYLVALAPLVVSAGPRLLRMFLSPHPTQRSAESVIDQIFDSGGPRRIVGESSAERLLRLQEDLDLIDGRSSDTFLERHVHVLGRWAGRLGVAGWLAGALYAAWYVKETPAALFCVAMASGFGVILGVTTRADRRRRWVIDCVRDEQELLSLPPGTSVSVPPDSDSGIVRGREPAN